MDSLYKPPLIIIGLAGAAVVYGFAAVQPPPKCVIVTDGSQTVYRHERAHCNGWYHEPFVYADPPPALFDSPFGGELTVIKCGRKYACKSVRKMCFQLWAERGHSVQQYANLPGFARFNGCQVEG